MSVPYTLYDADGRILKSGVAESPMAAVLQATVVGEFVLVGVAGDDATQQVVDGVLVARPTGALPPRTAEHIDREAATKRRALMPIDQVLTMLADAVAGAPGASQRLAAWREAISSIEAARMAAHAKIDSGASQQ